MELLKNLKLNDWWSLSVYIGLLGIVGSFFIRTDFVDSKNIFGFSFGLLIIGLSTLSAIKTDFQFKPANAYTGGAGMFQRKEIRHGLISGPFLIIGMILAVIFSFKIIIGLF
ncbi:MAG TPA: hypothetical protein PLH22_02415 [Candidatus Colwellbacteria bacterium]|nr:hypothetical protein [Candidatus Colwellbacteria bacterium]